MPFTYPRMIRFDETDAAGVVYFSNVLTLCHEAYEASLAAMGIDLRQFFGGGAIAVPIVHAAVDFFHPLYCGDRLLISLTPKAQSEHRFEIAYQIAPEHDPVQQFSRATTIHVCINRGDRQKTALPEDLSHWLQYYSEAV